MFLEAEEQPDTMDATAFPMLPGKGLESSVVNSQHKPKSVWEDPSRQIIGVNVVFGELVYL